MSIFGNRVLRVEDPRLLTDGGTYVADLAVPELDMIYIGYSMDEPVAGAIVSCGKA